MTSTSRAFATGGRKRESRSNEPEQASVSGSEDWRVPHLETQLAKFIEEQRSRGHAVSTEMAQMEALKLARELNIPREFRASRGWLQRFMRRHGFSMRRRTTMCQRLPEAYEEKLLNFQRYVIALRKEHSYLLSQVGNADQTPVYFEMPMDTTMEKRAPNQSAC